MYLRLHMRKALRRLTIVRELNNLINNLPSRNLEIVISWLMLFFCNKEIHLSGAQKNSG